jgi:hypothetical protein
MENLCEIEYVWLCGTFKTKYYYLEKYDDFFKILEESYGLQKVIIFPKQFKFIFSGYTLFKVVDKGKSFMFALNHPDMIEKPELL